MANRLPTLLLTAGLGTRLQPLTFVRAKPAVPVAGEPLVRRILSWLAINGVTDVVLNLHHLPATVTGIVGDGSDLGVHARYSWEQPRVLGSAGGPRQALSLMGAETFLVVNGDTLTNLNVDRLTAAHAASGALVTLALVPNSEPLRYSGLRLDGQGRVTGRVAKGPGAAGSFHFIGVQVVNASAFRHLTAGVVANSIGGVYDALSSEHPGSIRGMVCDAEFWDIGTPGDYWKTSWAFADRRAQAAPHLGERVHVDASATVTHSILWDDVMVGPDVNLEDCIVTDGVRIPGGTSYRRMIICRDHSDNSDNSDNSDKSSGAITASPLVVEK